MDADARRRREKVLRDFNKDAERDELLDIDIFLNEEEDDVE